MKPLLELLRIEEGERRAVGLCLLQAVFLGLPRLFTLAAGAALFLARYPAEDVPWVYIAASVVLPAAGLLHLAASRRVGFVRVQLGTLLVLAAVPALFLVLLRSSEAAWPAFALFVWCGAELHLSNIVLWSTANRLFTVRQGKRLFGLLGAGEIVAALAGGAAIPFLTRALGAAGLLSVSVAGFLLAFLGLSMTARAFPDRLGGRPERSGAGGDELRAGLRDRFLGLIFLTYALVLSAGFFVNSVFYFQVKEAFPTAAASAVFLGRFAAAASVLGLLLRSLLSARFLVRFGLVGGLVATPAALLAAALFVLHAGRSGAPETGLFAGVVALRLLERLLSGSLGQPAYYSLYQPLPRERRVRVQTAAETIAGPVAGGLTGALLLFLTKGLHLGAVGLTAAVLPLLGVWLLVAVGVGRAFPAALSAALRRRGVAGGDLSLSDPASVALLERGLESPRPQEVLQCLRLLEEAEHPGLGGFLLRAADHADPAVREAVYRAIERNPGPGWTPLLSERLGHERGAVLGALLRALGASGRAGARELLESAFAASSGEARRGALVALVRDAGAKDGDAVRELARQATSPEPGERATAARSLGEIGGTPAAEGLAPLLADADGEVRKAALRATGHVGGAELLRLAIPCLEDPDLRPEALRALLSFPGEASAALVAAWQAPGGSTRLRRLVLQALGRLRDPAAASFLAGELAFTDGQARSDVLWSLHLCGFRASGAARRIVESCFREEARRGAALVVARRDLAAAPGAELLVAALGQELARTQKRIFLLLSLVHDAEALLRIWSSFSVSPALRDLALELFESRVDRAQARLALPVLAETAAGGAVPPDERLRRILSGTRSRSASWLRACALDALAGRDAALAAEERAALLADDDALVRETAEARFRGGTGGRLAVVDRVRVLRATSLFREIDDEVLAELAPLLAEVAAAAGETVPGDDEVGGAMYVVAEGALGVAARPGDALLRPGDVFGELSALEPEAAPERARALEASRLLRLAGVDLSDFMSTRIEVVRGLIAALCQRARAVSAGRSAGARADRAKAPLAATSAERAHPGDALSPVDRLLALKSAEIFAEVSDEVLADVAGRTREVRLRRNEVLFRKGDPGTTTYVVASGRLRIHVGEKVLAEVGERAVVGELAALSSEPRTADVTAADDALLLTLDQETLFDLMLDQQEIARGVIRVLVGRLRGDTVAARPAASGLLDSSGSRARPTGAVPARNDGRE